MISESTSPVRRLEALSGSRFSFCVAIGGLPMTFSKLRNCAEASWLVARLVTAMPTNICEDAPGDMVSVPSNCQLSPLTLA